MYGHAKKRTYERTGCKQTWLLSSGSISNNFQCLGHAAGGKGRRVQAVYIRARKSATRTRAGSVTATEKTLLRCCSCAHRRGVLPQPFDFLHVVYRPSLPFAKSAFPAWKPCSARWHWVCARLLLSSPAQRAVLHADARRDTETPWWWWCSPVVRSRLLSLPPVPRRNNSSIAAQVMSVHFLPVWPDLLEPPSDGSLAIARLTSVFRACHTVRSAGPWSGVIGEERRRSRDEIYAS